LRVSVWGLSLPPTPLGYHPAHPAEILTLTSTGSTPAQRRDSGVWFGFSIRGELNSSCTATAGLNVRWLGTTNIHHSRPTLHWKIAETCFPLRCPLTNQVLYFPSDTLPYIHLQALTHGPRFAHQRGHAARTASLHAAACCHAATAT
jgi:hypothetical protein